MMIDFEIAVGLLIAWAVRKVGRIGRRVNAEVNHVLDASLDRLHDLVVAKLSGDPALEKLQTEAEKSGAVGTRTQVRVRMALEEAAAQDPAFAAELQAAVVQVQAAQLGGERAAAGEHGIAVAGGMRATNRGVAVGGVTGGSVSVGEPRDPPRSTRP
jgi:hypothetical protein